MWSDVQVRIETGDLKKPPEIIGWREDDQLAVHGFRALVLCDQKRKTRRIDEGDFSKVDSDVADAFASQLRQFLVDLSDCRNVNLADQHHEGVCPHGSNFGFEELPGAQFSAGYKESHLRRLLSLRAYSPGDHFRGRLRLMVQPE
jgi:hypothetical protein